MKPSISLTVIVLLVAIVGVASSSAFIVNETEQVVVVQFGEVVKLVDEPGLNFKIPVIQEAKRFDKRWLEWDGDANQITTLDKRYIYIDAFARWRISDPLVFIETLRDEISAQGRLDDIIDNATRNVIANHNLIEAIRSTNRTFANSEEETAFSINTSLDNDTDVEETDDTEASATDKDGANGEGTDKTKETAEDDADESDEEVEESKENTDKKSARNEAVVKTKKRSSSLPNHPNPYAIDVGRDKLTRLVLEKASAKASQLGIEIRDVQIKRINYIESVQAKVFDRMISERKRVAEAYRSDGQGRSAEIIGKMEMELQQIQSEAYKESQKIMGHADAKAAEIYAKAYNTNPEFYNFTKTMESYQETIDEESWLLLSTESDYARHLQTIKGKPLE